MTDEEANRLADQLMEKKGINIDYSYKKVHSSFCYQGILFENHRRFLNIETFTEIAELDTWLKRCLSPISVSVLGDDDQICVPSIVFDRVFILLHAAQHYGNGLLLRHLCDWVVLTQQEGLKLPKELTNKYFLRITSVFSQLANRYLGASIPVEGGEKLADEMMEEIMRPPFYSKSSYSDPIRAGWCKIRFKLHLLGLRNRLLGMSIWKGIMKLVLSVLSKPSRLYR